MTQHTPTIVVTFDESTTEGYLRAELQRVRAARAELESQNAALLEALENLLAATPRTPEWHRADQQAVNVLANLPLAAHDHDARIAREAVEPWRTSLANVAQRYRDDEPCWCIKPLRSNESHDPWCREARALLRSEHESNGEQG